MIINKKRIFALMTALMMMLISTSVVAFADPTTTTGSGDVIATVPVTGTVSALTVSVTHPATVAYAIDPNTGETGGIIAPHIEITNNSIVPVYVTVQSLASAVGGDLQLTDVAYDAQDWANLNVADSKTYIALGIRADERSAWGPGIDMSTHYAINTVPTLFGNIATGATADLFLVASHGLAFDQSFTAMHTLVFMFSLV